jgi:fumarate hydratase class I
MTTIREKTSSSRSPTPSSSSATTTRPTTSAPLGEAYEREESPAAKDAMAQILVNSRMAAEGHRPICQDTGIAIAFIKVGMDVRWDTKKSLAELVNEGVRRATPTRTTRCALDARGPRRQAQDTGDNTPAVTHVELVPGDKVDVIVAAKGGGSENKSKFAMLLPSDSIVDWVLQQRADHGRGLVPARHALARHRRLAREGDADGQVGNDGAAQHPRAEGRGAKTRAEELRLELYEKVNALGIGAQGWAASPPCST